MRQRDYMGPCTGGAPADDYATGREPRKLRTHRGPQLIDFTEADGSIAPRWMVPTLDESGGWIGWRHAQADEIPRRKAAFEESRWAPGFTEYRAHAPGTGALLGRIWTHFDRPGTFELSGPGHPGAEGPKASETRTMNAASKRGEA